VTPRVASRGVLLALVALAAAGCAATRAPSLASRLVTPGRPAVDVGGPRPVTTAGPGRVRPEARDGRAIQVAARRSNNLGTLEATSPALQRALLALSLRPSATHYLQVATAYTSAGVGDRAFDYLDAGIKQHPSAAALHDAVARLWRDWGFPDRGLAAAHRADFHAPRSAEARNTLGTVLWVLGERADARHAFAVATELDPGAWYAWHNLCASSMAAGDTGDAALPCRRAGGVPVAAGGAAK
jgi:Flp pilus assembly protein TadD